MDKVFVYGTLQREFGNHRWLESAGGVFLGKAVTVDSYPLIVDGLPYLIDEVEQGSRVHGEAYEVSDMAPLDRLEGHPNFYQRKEREVELESGSVIPVWIYFLNNSDWTDSDGKIYWSSYTAALGEREKIF